MSFLSSQLISINNLYYDASSRPSAITYRRTAILALLQLMEQRGNDSRSGAAQSVAESNRTTAGIDIVDSEIQDLQ